MSNLSIAVACRNASGMADLPLFTVRVTRTEYDLGLHYDKTEALAEAAGYERPFVCFDAAEREAIVAAAQALGRIPRTSG